MELVIKIALIAHVVAGAISLLAGVIAIISKKGAKAHILIGRIYVYAMTVIFVTAIFLSVVGANWFLFFVGVLSFYQVITGYRALGFKKTTATIFDKSLSMFILLGSLVALVYGLISSGLLFIVFGVLGAVLSGLNSYRFYTEKPNGKLWIRGHIAGMLGAFIATTTAFLINAIPDVLGVYAWFLPTIIGTPLIVYYLRQYKTSK